MQVFRWLRYFSHIPPRKVLGKATHVVKAKAIAYFPDVLVRPWPTRDPFQSELLLNFALVYQCMGDRFHDANLLENGVFAVKGVRKDFGSLDSVRWDDAFPSEPEKLHWMHDLAFFTYAIELVRLDPVRGTGTVSRLIRVLEANHGIKGGDLHFAWSPIALSLRIMGIATAAALARNSGTPDNDPSLQHLADHLAYCAALLNRTAERYLGYNHSAFAATALAVAACATGNSERLGHYANQAAASIWRHVLEDGMWEERSPTYHIHMLLLARSLLAMNAMGSEECSRLLRVVSKMQEALAALVHADGEIAVFNDAAIGDSVPPASVGWKHPHASVWHAMLPAAGYAQLRCGRTSVIFDAGIMGPDDVIGHGHGDFLSLEVCWNGHRLLVDPGVRSITGGEKRHETRSAVLHNGPRFDGLEPAEFFGTWRVGRRGRADFVTPQIALANEEMAVEGWCDGYASLSGGHRLARRVRLNVEGHVEIQDSWPDPMPHLRRRVSFLVPGTWDVDCARKSISFAFGEERATLTIENGVIVNVVSTTWNPTGPMQPAPAYLIEIDVSDDQRLSTYRLS
jgi:hypothetical protein